MQTDGNPLYRTGRRILAVLAERIPALPHVADSPACVAMQAVKEHGPSGAL